MVLGANIKVEKTILFSWIWSKYAKTLWTSIYLQVRRQHITTFLPNDPVEISSANICRHSVSKVRKQFGWLVKFAHLPPAWTMKILVGSKEKCFSNDLSWKELSKYCINGKARWKPLLEQNDLNFFSVEAKLFFGV